MSKKLIHLECQSGISGDMTVAALLDLGADTAVLEKALNSLPVDGFRTEIRRVKKSGLDACDFSVILDKEHENHDHDMEYLHGHDHSHDHSHGSEAEHGHEHIHEHRSLPGILHIISHGDMTETAKELAGKIFRILAEAEAKAHGVPVDQVHFHEVGAVDSIVDIVAAAVLLDDLKPDGVVITELCEGGGMIRCQHGLIPVPVPAVMHIAEDHGLTLRRVGIEGELVTPTGAAVAAAVRTSETLPSRYRILKSGVGAGKRNYERPSILRAMLLETVEDTDHSDRIVKLEANVDDCTGETLGYTMERLFAAGARDVHYIPVFMKKNRPGYQIDVICSPEDAERLEDVLFSETTTIGVRRISMERTVMARRSVDVKTPFGTARVKECRKGALQKGYPEYEDVKQLCLASGKSYPEMYQLVMECWTDQD